ncbi:MAG: CZB domain-containing protein [Candidatus Kapabacteria bacterium]|nr:CZB domain-containing protein [Candidatus Kapabacteria bacterium]
MDLTNAIEVHLRWKKNLVDFIKNNKLENLDPQIITEDNQCELGIWIYSQGSFEYSGVPVFEELKANHAHFHICAANVVKLKINGEDELAESMVTNYGTEYALATSKTINSITKLEHYIKSNK